MRESISVTFHDETWAVQQHNPVILDFPYSDKIKTTLLLKKKVTRQ